MKALQGVSPSPVRNRYLRLILKTCREFCVCRESPADIICVIVLDVYKAYFVLQAVKALAITGKHFLLFLENHDRL